VRGLLLYNPNATTTTNAVIDVITRALGDELKLDVEATKRRGHAGYLAAGAVHEGHDVVIALGGDGTMNEAMQGLVGTDVKLAIIPGGSTNVWARTLGYPNNAVEATAAIMKNLRDGRERRVNLGRALGAHNGVPFAHYFGFNAGFGFDAEVVRYVEQRYLLKRTVKQASFVYCALLAIASGFPFRAKGITVTPDDGDPVEGLRSVCCSNSDPYTYLGKWPARVCPDADIDKGLDVTGITRLGVFGPIRFGRTALSKRSVASLRTTRLWHDRPGFRITSSEPLPLQVDGDFVGLTDSVRVESVPHALTVVA
jgi:diacylglycerol kinase family enzyme